MVLAIGLDLAHNEHMQHINPNIATILEHIAAKATALRPHERAEILAKARQARQEGAQ